MPHGALHVFVRRRAGTACAIKHVLLNTALIKSVQQDESESLATIRDVS